MRIPQQWYINWIYLVAAIKWWRCKTCPEGHRWKKGADLHWHCVKCGISVWVCGKNSCKCVSVEGDYYISRVAA